MATFLVSGSGGFIGSTLVKRLSAANEHDVIALSRGLGPTVQALGRLPRVRCVTWSDLDASWSVDAVFNLASYGVRPQDRDPRETLRGNLDPAVTLLGLAASWGTRRFVHTGSCAEYARVEEAIRVDEGTLIDPVTLYGAAKAALSIFGATLARQLGVPWYNLRLFGTYGPGEAPHRLIPALVRAWSRGESAEMSPGTQVRDMTFVEDVVDALLLAGDASVELRCGTYNVCSGEPVSIADFARDVAVAAGVSEERLGLGKLAMRPGEQMWLVGDADRFHRATGWFPKTTRGVGIELAVSWARSEFGGGEER